MQRLSVRAAALAGAAVLSAAAALAGSAAAAPAPLTAKLSKPGYTLLALSADGRSTAVRQVGRAAVRLRPPARTVTLHLIDPKGVYAGPVVVGTALRGRRAILGVRAGAALGVVRIKAGYGRATVALPRTAPSAWATAKRGVPVGARVLGRVKATTSGPAGPGRDLDRDGLPGAFDVDANGNMVIDNVERSTSRGRTAGIAQLAPPPGPGAPPPGPGAPSPGGGQPAGAPPHLFSNFKLELEDSLNANAAGFSADLIDPAMRAAADLAIGIPAGDEVELDCSGLGYCSAGGTGTVGAITFNSQTPFPAGFDADGDGFGTITGGEFSDFHLAPNAGRAEIGAGDTFVYRIRRGASEVQQPSMMHFIFSTTPALVSWASGAGSAAVTYPAGPTSTGTLNNPIPVAADGRLGLTFWRPQREPLPGEAGTWIDIGRLSYTADLPNGPFDADPGLMPGGPPSRGPGMCPASSYTTSDPDLTVSGGPLVTLDDAAVDRPASPANTVSFTVDIDDCLASAGLPWSPGQTLRMDIQARSTYGDNAAQGLWVRRQ